LTTQLVIALEALSKEKTAWSTINRSLAEEKTAWHVAEQAVQSSNDSKNELTWELESTKASLTVTHDKLTSKSAAIDVTVIQEQQAKIQLTTAEEKLKAAEEKLQTQEQSLDSPRRELTKWELSSSMVISSATTQFKNHLPDLDMEVIHKDFTIDDAKQEALANSTYDAAHRSMSLYDFSSLTESDDNNSPRTL
jgi:chromosome segregation ATPase